jgi:hypothetical protein
MLYIIHPLNIYLKIHKILIIMSKNKILQADDNHNEKKNDDDNDSDYEYKQFLQNDIQVELILKIQNELVKYVSNGECREGLVLPLCEFLTVKDIRDFLYFLE